MAEASSKFEDVSKMLKDLTKDLEKMLEDMEKMAVKCTQMVYEMIMTQHDPALVNQMIRLEEQFLHCKKEIEKNWKDLLDETKETELQS